mmetsp:Transcript_73765/g.159665  ORF Transcript_73765/g.159665 Transcript_73765/m.159665 type:complete len:206 (-) Transcript_73765:1046-1663(-)
MQRWQRTTTSPRVTPATKATWRAPPRSSRLSVVLRRWTASRPPLLKSGCSARQPMASLSSSGSLSSAEAPRPSPQPRLLRRRRKSECLQMPRPLQPRPHRGLRRWMGRRTHTWSWSPAVPGPAAPGAAARIQARLASCSAKSRGMALMNQHLRRRLPPLWCRTFRRTKRLKRSGLTSTSGDWLVPTISFSCRQVSLAGRVLAAWP